MTIFNFITFIGGLAFFLYGMNVMSGGLEKIAGGKFEGVLKKMTSNRLMGLLLGMGITCVIQSSSALTVMLVGLVNSGIMSLSQSIGVIMGSNVGTTITAWILSLSGIESDNVFVQLLKPSSFAPVLAFIGILLTMISKNVKRRDIGKILIGFAVLMYGMELMGDAVDPLKDSPEFSKILTAFSNPVLGVVFGAVFTGIIQSSSASVGILQALSLTGSITYGMAIPIIMGQNIGTCVTAVISSIGVNRNAKRVSVVHMSFNLIGTFIFLILFYVINAIVRFEFTSDTINPAGIAVCHSIFNIATTALLIPFTKQLEKIANFVIKGKDSADDITILDERLLATPPVAISRCKEVTVEMTQLAADSFINSMKLLDGYKEESAKKIIDDEAATDKYEDMLGSYLVKISRRSLSVEDSHKNSNLLLTIGDIERISDHAVGIVKSAKEIDEKKIEFSAEGKKELKKLSEALAEIITLTTEAFSTDNLEIAKKIEPLEQVIDKLKHTAKNNHIARLQRGECTIETGFVFNDILTHYARTADHCSNIAVCLIQVAGDNFDTHEYLNKVKSHGDLMFDKMYDEYKEKYDA